MEKTEMAKLMVGVSTIAVLGAKDVPGHPVDMVGRFLLAAGFTVFPIHPNRKIVWGLPAYPTLADVPIAIDLVNVFRASEHCAGHARECLRLLALPRVFWMQEGITSTEAGNILAMSGIKVVEDACLMVEYKNLHPGRVKDVS
jgi:Predicted CoA-binding protein